MNLNKISLVPSILTVAALSVAVALSPVSASAKGGDRPSFEQLDTNSDGALTPAELAAHGAARFAAADTNSDGFLDAEELEAAAKARDSKRAGKRIERMMEHRDANGDGKLSVEEMAPSEDRIAKRFERADKNDDGQLSEEEFEASAKHRGHKRGKKHSE
jgi:hypothetical protein